MINEKMKKKLWSAYTFKYETNSTSSWQQIPVLISE